MESINRRISAEIKYKIGGRNVYIGGRPTIGNVEAPGILMMWK